MRFSKRARRRALPLFVLLSLAGACGRGASEKAEPAAARGNLFLHGPELVQNGSFTLGLQGWETWLQDGGDAVFAAPNGHAVIRVKTPATTAWGIQLHTHGLPLAAGRTYRLSFRARAEVPAEIAALVREHDSDVNGDGFPWSEYQYGTYALTTEWQRFMADVTMPVSDPNAGICFFAGLATGKVHIDDVSLVEVVQPPQGTELVDNGDFGARLSGWETWLQDGGAATFGMRKGSALVTVTTPATTSWGIQLHRGGLPLFAGHRYRLGFTAWAQQQVTIRALVQENGHDVNRDGSPWSEYRNGAYTLGTAPQRYTADFTAPVTNSDAGVYFFFGEASGWVAVDDVSVIEVPLPPPGAELITNGNFDAGFSGWTTYLMNGGQATFGAEGGEGVVDITAAGSDYSAIQLSNNGLPLEAGKTYRLTFRARAEQAGWIGTSIWENGTDTNGDGFAWSTYKFDWHEVGPTMAAFQVDFVMPVANANAGLCFFLGDLTGRFTVDDVSLTEIPGVPPPPPPPPPGTELIGNGTFDAGLDGWRFYVGGGADATVDASSGEAVVTTIVPVEYTLGNVALDRAAGFALYAGKTYRLTFAARSDAWASVYALVSENASDMDGDGNSYTEYGASWIQLNPVMTTYTIEFTAPATNPDVLLSFLLGDVAGQVVLDDVSLAEVTVEPPPNPGAELIGNGTFDTDLAGWSTYLMNGGEASYGVEAGEAVVSISSAATDYSGVQLSFNGVPLEAGKTYRLSFRARADGWRFVETSIWENGHDLDGNGFAWSTYRFDSHYLTPTMTTYTIDFVMPLTNSDAGLCFFLGEQAGQVFLDDVSLVELQ